MVFPVATFERLVNDPASGQAMLAEAATASAVATAMAASATEGASDGRAGIAAEFVAAPLGGQSLADAPPDGQTPAAAADSQRYDSLAGRWGNGLRVLMMCAWSAVSCWAALRCSVACSVLCQGVCVHVCACEGRPLAGKWWSRCGDIFFLFFRFGRAHAGAYVGWPSGPVVRTWSIPRQPPSGSVSRMTVAVMSVPIPPFRLPPTRRAWRRRRRRRRL